MGRLRMAAAVGPVCRGRGLAAGQSGVTYVVLMARVSEMGHLSHGIVWHANIVHRTMGLLTDIKAI